MPFPADSADVLQRAAEYIPGGANSASRWADPPLAIRRAAGAYIEDVQGRRYLDYHAAFGPMILGHCYPEVVESVAATLRETDLYGVGATELEVRLAEKIVSLVPSVEQVLLCNSGTEATYHAVRVARAVTRRKKLIKFQGCYHGWHDSVLMNIISPPDKVGRLDPGSAGMLEEALRNTLVCRFNDLEDVERAVAANPDQVAAIILEPIPHNIGCVMPRQEFLEGLRTLCDREGILLIFDEVITGFRHNVGGYQAICGVSPDLTTLGKAMANGFPAAAIGGKRDHMQHFSTQTGGDTYFAGTYNGHAVGTAAALATLELLETGRVHQHIFRLGHRLRAGLSDIVNRLGVRATVAGFGSVYVLYFMDGQIESYDDLLRNDADLFVRFRRELIKRGIYEYPVNLKRNHVSFSHTDADVDLTLEAAEDALRTVFAETHTSSHSTT
jgi:glutamate-1-semialdehyde 2,1-aminomutase